ncbi:hypothetical protein H5410_040924 [Solanum commersonii]|uniref:Uncharacterized protein n=1 Tax=Solanum commersonii TaxID=4109 RepID=A0A9J5XRJ4_SOLCO|nr:hypothetical protein H5410_040924 [Solanum commersonii]
MPLGIRAKLNVDGSMNKHKIMIVVKVVKSKFPNGIFAKQFLLSIEMAASKTIVVDKASQAKSRPITARVKVKLDLLANLT